MQSLLLSKKNPFDDKKSEYILITIFFRQILKINFNALASMLNALIQQTFFITLLLSCIFAWLKQIYEKINMYNYININKS